MAILSFFGGKGVGEAVDTGTKSKHSSGPHMQDDSAGLRLNEHLRFIDARRIRMTKFSATHADGSKAIRDWSRDADYSTISDVQ